MKNTDKIKVAIYNYIISSKDFNFSFLGGEFKAYHLKLEVGKKELNKLIDNIDIRALQFILNTHPEIKTVKWIKQKQYTIDYNKNNELDFIRIEKECYC